MSNVSPLLKPLVRPLTRAITEAGVASFSPIQIPNLEAWWDDSDLSTLFSDAARTTPAVLDGEVLGGADKSGQGRHWTATTGTAPILRQRTDGAHYLDYTGGKTRQVPSSTAMFNYLHDGTGGSVVACVEWPQSGSTSNYLRNLVNPGTQVGASIAKVAANQNYTYNICRGVAPVTAQGVFLRTGLSSPLRTLIASYEYNGAPAATDMAVSWDSSRTVTRTTTAQTPSTSNAAANLSVATDFLGREYEVMIYSSVLTDTDRQNLGRYMRRHDYPVAGVDLLILRGGQSNAVGLGLLTPTSAEKQIGVYMFNRADEFKPAIEPLASLDNASYATSPAEASTPQFSFGLTAGKALLDDAATTSLWVPCAVSSTSIAQWSSSDPSERTSLLGSMLYRYRQTKGRAGAPVIVWYGHEASTALATPDYTNGGVGTAYQTAFAALIGQVRALDPDLAAAPMVFCQLASDDTLATAVANAAGGEALRQCELSIADAFMVVTHDLARNASTDDIHLSRAGQEALGERIALAIREHVLGESVNGTGPRIVSASYSGSTVTLTCDKEVNTTAGNYGSLFRVYAGGVEQTVSSANRGTNTSTVEIVCSAPLAGTVTLTYGYRAGPASAARTDVVKDGDGLPLPLFGPVVVTP